MGAAKGNKNATGNKGGGNKTKYKKEYADLAYKYCLLGATDEQLAFNFDVTERTIRNWKKHLEFVSALKKGKVDADARVAEALYQRALGYSHPDVHISNYQGSITVTPITKHYPPDTAAAFIWLKNRAGWKDKTEHILKDDRLTDAERENLRNILKERQQPLKLVKGA